MTKTVVLLALIVSATATASPAATCNVKSADVHVNNGLTIIKAGRFSDILVLRNSGHEAALAAQGYQECVISMGGEEPQSSVMRLRRTLALTTALTLYHLSGIPHEKTDRIYRSVETDLTHLMMSPDLSADQQHIAADSLKDLRKTFAP